VNTSQSKSNVKWLLTLHRSRTARSVAVVED